MQYRRDTEQFYTIAPGFDKRKSPSGLAWRRRGGDSIRSLPPDLPPNKSSIALMARKWPTPRDIQ